VNVQAERYLAGLLQSARRNVQRIAEVVPGTNAQALHHFLSDSPWDSRAVMDQVARDTDALLGGDQDSCLLLDETCFAKKGMHSVGVARQWLGLQGKTDNCQVAVFAALVRGERVGLIDTELYLPECWVSDAKRCEVAGVPAERRVLKTKPALALELVERARRNGVRFSWVAADGTYGQDRALLRALDDAGETFVCDVHRDQQVWLKRPSPRRLQQAAEGKDKTGGAIRVDAWLSQQPAESWQRTWVRHSSQGELHVEALAQQVWLLERKQEKARCWRLIVTREVGRPETTKFSLTNAPEKTSVARLAYLQRQRYWIERAFQDAKNEAGMDEYQARGWNAWYHHMALVMMAMLFLLRERILLRERTLQQDAYPLLSTADVKILLARLLPRRDLDFDEVIRQLQRRHAQRESAINSAWRRRRRLAEASAGNLTK
jgi:SRSO17 transposase